MVRDIDDIADERARGIQSTGEGYYDTFLSKRPKTEWSPYIDETAKDICAGIQISEFDLSRDNFGREIGEYYRRGLNKTASRYADLPSVLEREVSDDKLGLLAYQLNELSYQITSTDLGINNVHEATEAVIEKLLTRHAGKGLNGSLQLTGGTVADIATQLFKNETVASNVDVLLTEFKRSASKGLLALMDEPQMMTPLWDHQRDALEQWCAHGSRGYVDMATATGKTVLGLAAIALRYGELHPDDQELIRAEPASKTGNREDVLIVAHSDLILEQWRREFDRHLNIPKERTTGAADITLEWGTVHFRTPQALVNEERIAYDLVLLDEAHHYATGSDWGSLLDEFDGAVLAMSGSVDDAGTDSDRIKKRLSNSIGSRMKRYTIREAKADGVIPSFDWEVQYAPYDIVGNDLQKASRRAEQTFQAFQQKLRKGEVVIDTDRRLKTYDDLRRFSHTTEGSDLKQQNDEFRELVTRLFSRRTTQWNLSPVLDAVVDLVMDHCTTEKVVVLADSNAQVEELDSRLRNLVSDSTSIFIVSKSQSREEQRKTIESFDDSESAGVLLGTGDLIGEGVDMQQASVAINMATGGVNPELVQRIGRVLRNPVDMPKHAMFYNVVGAPPTIDTAVPREDGMQILEQAAGFCALGHRFDKLPGFSTAEGLDKDSFASLLQEGASFIRSLDTDWEYEWDTETVQEDDLLALITAVETGEGDTDTILGEWEEYAWEHSTDESSDVISDDESEVAPESSTDTESVSRVTLVDEIKQVATDLDKVPTKADMRTEGEYDIDQYEDEFGTWSAGVSAAGFEPHGTKERDASRNDVIEALQKIGADVGEPPTVKDINERAPFSANAVYNYFDGIDQAREAAGFESQEPTADEHSREDIIAGLRTLGTDIGEPPTVNDINERAPFSASAIYTHFDGIGEAREAAEVTQAHLAGGQTESPGGDGDGTSQATDLPSYFDTLEVPDATRNRAEDATLSAFTRLEELVRVFESDQLEPLPDKTATQTLEAKAETVVEQLQETIVEIVTKQLDGQPVEQPSVESLLAHAETVAPQVAAAFRVADGELMTTLSRSNQPDTESDRTVERDGVVANPLAEYYELFRTYESLLGRIIESEQTTYASDKETLMNQWHELIETIVYGDGLGEAPSYGAQQGNRNPVTMPAYRRAFGDGETVSDYVCIPTSKLPDGEKNELVKQRIINSNEQILLPVTPETGVTLPLYIASQEELAEAKQLLEEFPIEPAAAPGEEDTSPSDQEEDGHNAETMTTEQTESTSTDETDETDGQTDGLEPLTTEKTDSKATGEDRDTDNQTDGTAQSTAEESESNSADEDKDTDGQTDGAESPPTGGGSPEQEIFWDQSVDPITEYTDEIEGSADDTPSARDGLDKKIDEWKSQLLDLTRRNKLIAFKPTKTKSLPFDDANPITVANELASDTELYIRKRPEDEENDGQAVPREELSDIGLDELLPTRVADEAEKSLYNIGLNNKQYLRERGVDTLYLSLGMLRWYSVDYSDEANRSPLFLAPIELVEQTQQETGRHDYVLKAKAEGLRLNPALRKKLTAERDIRLPADSALSLEDIDAAFESVYETVQGFDRWTIQSDVILGIFDFTKFSLYSDLERNRPAIKSNPIIRALNGDMDTLQEAEGDIETPSAAELDDVVDPVDTYQVLDADSSQQEAIEAAKRGKSFVLQGPPGTGKSQTIANIIAEKLAMGEKVLFVSEKQAALDVVKNRLDDVGIGRFCLEVHGERANHNDVLSSLEDELKAEQIKSAKGRVQRLQKLRSRRDRINAYGDDLFYSPDGWDLTAYQAFGIISEHMEAPRVEIGIDQPVGLGQDAVSAGIDALETLARFESEIDTYETSPWRHTTLSQWGVDTGDSMRRSLDQQITVIGEMRELADDLDSALGVRPDSVFGIRRMAALLEHLSERPTISWQEAFFDETFAQEGSRLDELAELEQERDELMETLSERYQRSFFSTNGAELNNELAAYGLLKVLKPSYRSLKRKITTHTKEEYDPGHDQLLEDTRMLAEVQRIEDRRDDYQGVIQRLGPLYEGSDTDWETLAAAREWVASLDGFSDFYTSPIKKRLLAGSLPEISSLSLRTQEVLENFGQASSFFKQSMAVERMSVNGESLHNASLSDLTAKLEVLERDVSKLQQRVQFESQLDAVRETVCADYVDRFIESGHPGAQLVSAFKRRFYTEWLNSVYEHTALSSFNSDEMERYIEEFRQLDQEQQELAKIEIQHRVTQERPSLSLEHASSSEQVMVRREAEKQRRHKPLRELFDEAGSFITRLTPCFMMSPLSVAQYLKAGSIDFDTVVFDEASQIMPQDAVSSLIRADQAVIAGDTKQLPPTSFFSSDVETTEDVREDLESILEETASVLPEKHLQWHYRSKTDELIEFSNYHYYNNSLRTFPENDPDVDTGVEFEYVEDGVYDRGGSRQNEVEAQRVVDLIEAHAENHSDKSLGVVAFSSAQEQAIRDVLEVRREESPVLDAFVSQDDVLDEFFIKNLEMVQGDERDRMLFSVGYGPAADGTISTNFGPINKSGGERRLNVAVTRAKEKVTVVCSMLPGDIDLSGSQSTGAQHFKNYLEYARQGQRALERTDSVTQSLDFDSTFEEAVYTALDAAGHDVVSQVQSSSYSIDLAIKHPDQPGKFILGIECDGAAYHSSKTARDRDRTRQMVLESLGWTIHRIWSPDWASNREREIEQIDQEVASLRYGSTPSTSAVDVQTHEPEVMASRSKMDHPGITEFGGFALESSDRYAINKVGQSTANRNSVQDTVKYNGPIEYETAMQTFLDVWSQSRAGKQVQRIFKKNVRKLKQQNKIYERDGFLWPTESDLDFVVRVNTDDHSRSIEDVPVEEVAKAISILLAEGGTMTKDDLILETTRLFGYQRRGQRIEEKILDAISVLEGAEAVAETSEGRYQINADVDTDAVLLSRIY